jgi:hypothetical protein
MPMGLSPNCVNNEFSPDSPQAAGAAGGVDSPVFSSPEGTAARPECPGVTGGDMPRCLAADAARA